jgi:DNA adenine methylase
MFPTVTSSSDGLAHSDPFLKWAGGKRWLIQRFPDLIPSDAQNYFEPFLGSGAVYFHVRPPGGTISDLNEDLIDTYPNLMLRNWSKLSDLMVAPSVNSLQHALQSR